MYFEKPERKISWEEVHNAARELARAVRESGYQPDYLVGIAVGGLIPVALLAEELSLYDIKTISARSYQGKVKGEVTAGDIPEGLQGKKVLLVDDVAETGATLQKVSEILKRGGVSELKTATLAVNTDTCTFMPDFYALGDTAWIAFPWEKED